MIEFHGPSGGPPSSIEAQTAAAGGWGRWFACQHPERPFDYLTVLHDCCTTCLIAARAAVAVGQVEAASIELLIERLDEWGPAPTTTLASFVDTTGRG